MNGVADQKLFPFKEDYSIKRVSTEELSALMGITSRRIQQLENELPSFREANVGRGMWICARAIQAYIEYRLQGAKQEADKDEPAQDKLTRIKAEREELRLKEEQGKLVKIDLVHSVYKEIMLNVKTQILMLPRRLAIMKLSSSLREKETMISEEIEKALQEISDNGHLNGWEGSQESEDAL
ncbi:hypothetical protein [Prosthecochloris sp.]|uniref:hypothetical protein n=1 Tax=Prosthecochloris sp. TaxID=290513 RepID=UPI0025F67C48|nr:hypothetical protein [Prosthecochloris sp.]